MSIFNKNRWIRVAIGLLLVANICTLVLLWQGRAGDGPPVVMQPGGGPFEFISKELQLSPAQKEAYARLRDEHRAAARDLQDGIRAAKDAFFDLLKNETVSDSTLRQYSSNITQKEAALDLLTFRHFQQVRTLCNAAQQERFDGIIQQALLGMKGPPGGPPPLH